MVLGVKLELVGEAPAGCRSSEGLALPQVRAEVR